MLNSIINKLSFPAKVLVRAGKESWEWEQGASWWLRMFSMTATTAQLLLNGSCHPWKVPAAAATSSNNSHSAAGQGCCERCGGGGWREAGAGGPAFKSTLCSVNRWCVHGAVVYRLLVQRAGLCGTHAAAQHGASGLQVPHATSAASFPCRQRALRPARPTLLAPSTSRQAAAVYCHMGRHFV